MTTYANGYGDTMSFAYAPATRLFTLTHSACKETFVGPDEEAVQQFLTCGMALVRGEKLWAELCMYEARKEAGSHA